MIFGTSLRVLAVVVPMLIALIAVAHRASHIANVEAEEVLRRGAWMTQHEVSLQGPRGSIVDRDGRVLAQSLTRYRLALDTRHFFQHHGEHWPVLQALLLAHDLADPARMHGWTRARAEELPRYVALRGEFSEDEVREMLAPLRAHGIRSVYPEARHQRAYPHEAVAGHVLGFARPDQQEGNAGIEFALNDALQGRWVTYTVHRDAARRAYLMADVPDLRHAQGDEVVLTLDLPLQRLVEQELAATVDHHGAQGGSVIVSVPDTGEILAMASWPPVDPNHARRFPLSAWQNPAVSHAYEPGSTGKVFTAAIALEQGIATPSSSWNGHHGRYRAAGHLFSDTKPQGWMDMVRAMQISSNIVFVQVGLRMQDVVLREGLTRFGIGQQPRSGLPGETAGLLRATPWREIERANVSFGHGYAISAMQLHRAICVVANRGVDVPQRIVRGTRSAGGALRLVETPAPRRVLSEAVAEQTHELIASVSQGDGTGRRAAVPGYTVAGKTGTAEMFNAQLGRYEDAFVASFTGYVEGEGPLLAITVMVVRPSAGNGHTGGSVAAPLFGRVARHGLQRLGQPMAPAAAQPPRQAQSPEAQSVGDTGEGGAALAAGASDAAIIPAGSEVVTVPATQGMPVRQAALALHGAGLVARVQGVGRVATSVPPAGQRVVAGTHVVLTLETPQTALREARQSRGTTQPADGAATTPSEEP